MRPSPRHSGDTAAALSRLARQAPPEEVLWQLEGLVRANLRPQIYHLNAVLNACGRTGDWRFAVDHLQKIVQHGLWPNKFSFSAAISACEKGNHWQVALALLAGMPEWKVAADTVVFNTAISACGKSEQWEAALHLLHGMHDSLLEADAVSFNAAIVACRNSWQRASQLLQDALVGHRAVVNNWNAAASTQSWEAALSLLQALQGARAQADVVSFSALFGALGIDKRWPLAGRALQQMREKDIDSDVVCANAAANACAQGGVWQAAWSFLQDLCMLSLRTDQGLVSSTISGTRVDAELDKEGGAWIFALRILRHSQDVALPPSAVSRSNALCTCGKSAAWEASLRLFASLQLTTVEPDSLCHTVTINAWQAGDRWRHASAALEAMPCERLSTDAFAHGAALCGGRVGAAWAAATAMLRTMQSGGVRASAPSDTAAIGHLAREGQWLQALQYFAKVQMQQSSVEATSCCGAIRACQQASTWDWALAALSAGRDAACNAAALGACRNGRQWIRSASLLMEMLTFAVKLDIASRTSAASAASAAGEWSRALSLLCHAATSRAVLDEKSFLITYQLLRQAGQEALGLVLDVEELADSAQFVSFMPWALASMGGGSSAEDIHGAMAEAAAAIRHEAPTPMALASLWWSASMLGVISPSFARTLSKYARQQVDAFRFGELLMVLWGACGSAKDQQVQLAFQREAADRLDKLDWASLPRPMQIAWTLDCLGSLWACTFSRTLTADAHHRIRAALLRFGGMLDRIQETVVPKTPGSQRLVHDDSQPAIVLDASDSAVLFKPADYEVHDENSDLPQLSCFMSAMFCNKLPILHDEEHEHGFLHRLDVPSSGLILAAKSFECYYDLQVQLVTGQILRDYVVLSHGWMEPAVTDISAQVMIEDGGRTMSGGRGKPGLTHVKVAAHAEHHSAGVTLVVIRIGTGRRHQIRSHLAHKGHPTVTDGRYTSLATFLRDSQFCRRNFLHRYFLGFMDGIGRRCCASSDAPEELQLVLDCLHGKTPQCCATLQTWRVGNLPPFDSASRLGPKYGRPCPTHTRLCRFPAEAQMARPEAFEIWEAFETRPLSAGSSIPGVDGLPSRSMRRPRSSTRLQAEVEMNRAQAQLSELRKKLHAESREVERLQQCLDAANGEASHQRTLAQAAQVEIGKLHQRLAASEEAVQASQAVQDAAGRAAGDAERRLQAELFELTARLRQAESGREITQSDQIELKQRLEEKAAYAATRAAEQALAP
ncbi:EMB2654 [Symbiodinium sp. CCMP2456]|nr:EMB2654 [Symbiodinium sp. CCMP2456]